MNAIIVKEVCCEPGCRAVISCYVSNREPKRIECKSCQEKRCPTANRDGKKVVCESCYKYGIRIDEKPHLSGLSWIFILAQPVI